MAEQAQSPTTSETQPVSPKLDQHFTPQLNKALATAQGAFAQPKKTATLEVRNKEGKLLYTTKYAPLEAVIEAIRGPLSTAGIRFSQYPVHTERGSRLVLKVAHESGEYEIVQMPLNLEGGPQQIAGQLTYMKRYQLSAYFGVAADEDDDGNAAQDQGNSVSRPGDAPKDPEPPKDKPPTSRPGGSKTTKPKAESKPKTEPPAEPKATVTSIRKGADPGSYPIPQHYGGATIGERSETGLKGILGSLSIDKKKMPVPIPLGEMIELERQIKLFFEYAGVKL